MKKLLRKWVILPLKQLKVSDIKVSQLLSKIEFDRLAVLMGVLVIMTASIIFRLFTLQVIDYNFYTALASDQHEIQSILHAERGQILLSDYKEPDKDFYAATNKPYYQVYAVPKQIGDPEYVTDELYRYVNKSKEDLLFALSKEGDPYEPVEKKVGKERMEAINSLNLPGIHSIEETYRYYIDDNIGGNVIGFLGIKDNSSHGLYGIEGYFQEELAGVEGFFQTERDVAGRWIALTEKNVKNAEDGSDILLTIDRTLQYQTCETLNQAVIDYDASGGSIVVLNPYTGAVLSMCSNPDFNPNYYSDVNATSDYNNKAIFEAYESGSIFKPIVMAAAMDLDYVAPDSTFIDTGSVTIDEYTIKNADEEIFGEQNMAGVLEKSINTGMIHVARLMGQDRFLDYVQRFGFGEITGIELQTEVAGNISSLKIPAEIYMATASFGQGITVTPLQVAVAYGAIANGGMLMRPYIVDEIRNADGSIEKTQPTAVRQVLSDKTSVLMTGMLTSVVMNGHAGNAQVPGYYVAGKTGTAQIAGSRGEYLDTATNHSFAGYAPADDPKFVIVVKLERPRNGRFSASTAAKVFGSLTKYALNYYEVQPDY